MPAISHRGRGRRTISEINMVPFIDVMLVLLIIFMVTAPLITTGVVELPSVGQAGKRRPKFVELVIASDSSMKIRVDGKEVARPTTADLAARIAEARAGDPEVAVVISGDKDVKYDSVVKAMGILKGAKVEKVGLMVKTLSP